MDCADLGSSVTLNDIASGLELQRSVQRDSAYCGADEQRTGKENTRGFGIQNCTGLGVGSQWTARLDCREKRRVWTATWPAVTWDLNLIEFGQHGPQRAWIPGASSLHHTGSGSELRGAWNLHSSGKGDWPIGVWAAVTKGLNLRGPQATLQDPEVWAVRVLGIRQQGPRTWTTRPESWTAVTWGFYLCGAWSQMA